MKYIKTFEASKNKLIDLYSLSDSSIITVNKEELDELIENDFTILYDDEEISYDKNLPNQWRYDDEEEDIKKFLKSYRSMINVYSLAHRSIIRMTIDEIKVLQDEDFTILYDDEEISHDPLFPDQWRYDDDEEEDIKKWLDLYRTLKDPELVNSTLKFNL